MNKNIREWFVCGIVLAASALQGHDRLYPRGSPSRNSQRPKTSPGLRGGLEIVFNQQ
ncbi:uncharacterized protein LOC124825880 [Vigna umbellata]|uniref:uncharacterized protein LOC124825880 n=1 Tax=Vigna umbellata TaxID=87088 RepID=UPI001F5FB191|nr:uncharacterized protein LOC124825880 [Vigna umbellata]